MRPLSFVAVLLGVVVAVGPLAAAPDPLPPSPVTAEANDGEKPTLICTDRPTKANFACTVPVGDVQLESDALNWTHTRADGVGTTTIVTTNPTLKYGLGRRTDLELNLAPYTSVTTSTPLGRTHVGGVGDLYIRVKQRLTPDPSPAVVAILPFLKVPTAPSGVGNGRWEGGVVLPVNLTAPAGFLVTLGPELDVLVDRRGAGRHVNLTSLVNLSHGIGPRITLYAEFWNSQNLDPAGTVHQYSTDFAVTYAVTPTVQLDAGGNFGLNRATPGAQVYVGLATRF